MSNNTYFDLKDSKVKVHKGQFTNCYIHPDYDYVILHSIDQLKECAALWLNEENIHLPEIERISSEWYIMPKYEKLTAKHKKAYSLYKALVQLSYSVQLVRYSQRFNYDLISEFINKVNENIDETLSNAMFFLLESASNATSNILFDCKKENFSVDSNGNLILRDIFADLEKVKTREVMPKKVLYTIGSTH